MKTKGILIVLAIAIFASSSLFAGTITKKGGNLTDTIKHRMDIRVNNDNQVVLRAACLENQKRVDFVLKVYSDNGEMVLAESFHKKGGIYKGFDMKTLPDGKYRFEIFQKLKKVYVKEVVKSSEIVSLEDGRTKMIVQEL
jgi:hypothetical protein